MVRASSSQPTIDITAPPEFFGTDNVDQLLFTPEVLSSTDPLADESPIRIEGLPAINTAHVGSISRRWNKSLPLIPISMLVSASTMTSDMKDTHTSSKNSFIRLS